MSTIAKGHILVIAPDSDLRRSLEFALEADGYVVTAWPSLDITQLRPGVAFDCTVLDHGALTAPPGDVVNFCIRARPVVLLSNSEIFWLSEWIVETVEKPTPGDALSAAIRAAMRPNSAEPISK